MSWIGGLNDSFNQLTSKAGQISGQLSSFTKEVLTETTEEDLDYEAQAKALKLKLDEAEAVISEHQTQVARQQQSISELEELCRRSELDAHSRVCEYEAKLEHQRKLLNKLKHGNEANDEFQLADDDDDDYRAARRTVSGTSQDAADFADVISYQREASRLSSELEFVREEKEKWKAIAERAKHQPLNGRDDSHGKVQELEFRLHEAIDRHQQEYLALQQANSSTVHQLQEEIRTLRVKLSSGDGDGEPLVSVSDNPHLKEELMGLKAEQEEAKERLRTKNRQLQLQKKNIDELRVKLQTVEKSRDDLSAQNKVLLTEIDSLKTDKVGFEKKMSNDLENLQRFHKSMSELVAVDVSDVSSHDNIVRHVTSLHEDRDKHRDAIATLQKQIELSEKEKLELIETLSESSIPASGTGLKRKLAPLYQSSPAQKHDRPLVSPPTDDDPSFSHDVTADQFQALEKQVEAYEAEIADYQTALKKWREEKESFKVMLARFHKEDDEAVSVTSGREEENSGMSQTAASLRKEVLILQEAREAMERDKEQLIEEKNQLRTVVTNLEGKLNQSLSETQTEKDQIVTLKAELESALNERSKLESRVQNALCELDESRSEKNELDDAIEALDAQHQEEMTQLLIIREEAERKLKRSESELDCAMNENNGLKADKQRMSDELAALRSDLSELKEVRESAAALADENKKLVRELETMSEKLRLECEKSSLTEKNLFELEDALKSVKNEKKSLSDRLSVLEEKSKFSFEASVKQKEAMSALEELKSSLVAMEAGKRKAESEQDRVASEFNELKKQVQELKKENEALCEEAGKSERTCTSSLEAKDTEMNRLRSELDLLNEENKKRIEQLTQNTSVEASSREEILSLKNELQRAQQKLKALSDENQSLIIENQTVKQRAEKLEAEVELKSKKLMNWSEENDQIRSENQEELNDTVVRYDLKLSEMTQAHEREVLELQQDFDAKIAAMREELGEQVLKMQSEHDENLSQMQEEKASLGHENKTLADRIKFMEQSVASDFELVQGKLQESNTRHDQEKNEFESLVERLTKELNRERSLVENLEEELKKQMDFQDNVNRKKEEEYSQLYSDSLNEKNTLKTAFDEEKSSLFLKHSHDLEKLKLDFENEIKNIEDRYAREMASEVYRLKEDFEKDNLALKDQILILKEEHELKTAELHVAQDELNALSSQFVNEEEKWKSDSAVIIERLKQNHMEELALAKSESDELIQRNMHQPDSISDELLQSQLNNFQEENERLKAELERLETAEEQKNTLELDLQLKSNETAELTNRITALVSQIEELENDIERLSEENRRLKIAGTPQPPNSELGGKSTIELLKQGSDLLDLPDANIRESLARDLEGLEKADLSKDDISSLLTLIKERDNVISTLYESNNDLSSKLKSQTASDSLNKLKQLSEEKEQIMNVISDKTKENRQLKDEIHRMVDVISANNNALSKLQEENQVLITKYEGFDQEMTKETVTRLSKLISEKDLEIESLRQKCQTLLDVLQQQDQRQTNNSSSKSDDMGVSTQQVQVLLRDRETLSQQVRQLLAERDHLVALLNSKHQEALVLHERAQKAVEALEADAAENSRLQIQYSNLVHDYDQVELKLASVVKELARFKESLNDIEESKEILLNKLDIANSSSNHISPPESSSVILENLRSDSSKSSGEKSKEELERIVDRNSESLLQKDVLLKESCDRVELFKHQIDQLQNDIRVKDILIHQKSKMTKQINEELTQKSNEIKILRKSVENLREQISTSSQDASSLSERLSVAERTSHEKESEAQAFQETNAQLSVMLKERDYELESLKEKVRNLEGILKRHEQGKNSETQQYLKELDRLTEQATTAKHERDQIMLTLKQKQIETQRATDESRALREKEVKLDSELSRLRSHLIQVEEAYTQEAVLANDRELVLRERLEQIETRSNSAAEENELSRQQLESMQEQVRTATHQRDQAIRNFQLAKEQSTQYASALQQLQMAAERMQREEAATYAARVDKINQQLQAKSGESENLVRQVADLNAKLEEANVVLESASRLNEQLEIKEQSIDQLKDLVSAKQLELEELQDELHRLNTKSENLVDRQLVKNLLIGYFNSPVNKQEDVIRLISSMIGFTKEEEMRLFPSKKGWVSGLLSWGRGGSATPHTTDLKSLKPGQLNESFTDMFVKFLESESTSRQPAAKLPAAAMVNDAQLRMNQRKSAVKGGSIPTPVFNPPQDSESSERSTVAGRYNPLLVTSPHTTVSPPTQSSHPLMQPLGAMLPTFAPVASSKTSEGDMLEHILHDDQKK